MRISDWSSDGCSSDLSERHESVGPLTNTWPSRLVPVGLPTISTKASRAACAGASGHGWFDRHVPSLSRAAMPARRMRGPSAHQTGPSPSQTRVGVHKNVWPAGTTGTSARSEEHTSELQSLMRTAYAVFCLQKNKKRQRYTV